MALKQTVKRTAAIYARYSSDTAHTGQKDRSVDDQILLCREIARRHDAEVVGVFSDRAISGASTIGRDGLHDLMRAATAGQFNTVIIQEEARLARDQIDMLGMITQFQFLDIELITQDGVSTRLSASMKGMFAEMFNENLGKHVRRAQFALVKEGKIPGAVTYGYRLIKDKPGEREIDPVTAPVVVRIFQEYAAGTSPRTIAKGLTRDGIPAPGGGKLWNQQTFVGGRLKKGMIGNPIYVGVFRWFQSRNEKKREGLTGDGKAKKVKKLGRPEDLLEVQVPHLRIIEQSLWNAANKLREDRAVQKFGPDGKVLRRPVLARTQHLLAGLLYCATCGSHMRIAQQSRNGGHRVACAAAHQHMTCEHTKTYDMNELLATVRKGMGELLANPKAFEEATKAYHAQRAKRAKEDRGDLAGERRALDNVMAGINRMVTVLGTPGVPVDLITDKLKELEIKRVGLVERVKVLEAQEGVVDLHPKGIQGFRLNLERLHFRLENAVLGPQDREAMRSLIARIVVQPTAKRMPYQVDVFAHKGALAGIDLFPKTRTPAEMVDGSWPYAVATASDPSSQARRYSNSDIVPLGRWTAAA